MNTLAVKIDAHDTVIIPTASRENAEAIRALVMAAPALRDALRMTVDALTRATMHECHRQAAVDAGLAALRAATTGGDNG